MAHRRSAAGGRLTKRYAAGGHRVLACCREPEKATELQALAKSLPGVTIYGVNVAAGESVAALASKIGDTPIDILINIAGMPGLAPKQQSLQNMDFDAWAQTFAVNTMAPPRILKALRANLKAGNHPRAVTITSQMGAIAFKMPVMYAYCASKAVANKMMNMASVELASDGIAVRLVRIALARRIPGTAVGATLLAVFSGGFVSPMNGSRSPSRIRSRASRSGPAARVFGTPLFSWFLGRHARSWHVTADG
jgi:NAD(P)-dependent dehydrogenase (short-subunit alcohol dehydrogenase family)